MTHQARLFASAIAFFAAYAWFAAVVHEHVPELAMRLVVGGGQ